MVRSFVYVILGGGVAAGYAAHQFVRSGVPHGEVCIISSETVAPYERPALSKGFLLPEDPVRLPLFHCCVGTNEERLSPRWYRENGIELILGTRVQSVDVNKKKLVTAAGEIITYKTLIVATGARQLMLEEFGVTGTDADKLCYLQTLADAQRLVNVMQSCSGRNAIVIGGGYIGMECAASLVMNNVKVTMVIPEAHCMYSLFTPKIASYYEEFYESQGVKFVKEAVLASLDVNSQGEVTAVNLKDGTKLPADMVLVGIGIHPNTSLFEGQLTLEKGGIKVNGRMQSSNPSVYAVGDVAAFPIKAFGEIRRLENVESARKSARHAVTAIMDPDNSVDFDYLPYFYSRAFSLSWQFYGDNVGEAVHFGDYSGTSFGAYWINKGHIVGSFLEGGTQDEYEALSKMARLKPKVDNLEELEKQGIGFALTVSAKSMTLSKPIFRVNVPEIPLYTAAGVFFAVAVVALGYCYGRRRQSW